MDLLVQLVVSLCLCQVELTGEDRAQAVLLRPDHPFMGYLVASAHWGVARVVPAAVRDQAWGDVEGLGECLGFRDTVEVEVEVVLKSKAIPGEVLL